MVYNRMPGQIAMLILWVKAFHIIAMVAWFAGLFYLPRLFVYHAMTEDEPGKERFKIMERKLYYAITTPGAMVTLALGLWLIYLYGSLQDWLVVKLILVAMLLVYHVYCGVLVRRFAMDTNTRGHRYYRWLNEIPTLLLIGIVVLAVVKPL